MSFSLGYFWTDFRAILVAESASLESLADSDSVSYWSDRSGTSDSSSEDEFSRRSDMFPKKEKTSLINNDWNDIPVTEEPRREAHVFWKVK